MFSITHGEVSFDETYALIKSYLALDKRGEYRVSIGADSQNFSYTKIPIIIGIHKVQNNVGRGGIFFAEIKKVKRISNIRQKILYETNLSLELATKLRERFAADNIRNEISIHVDAGYNGPTRYYIQEIMGWVKACGFRCVVKPDSYMASSVANRLSK
ncbi:MAG: ribonuclease H-like YkuK family protein [Desulfitobacteriaceae bacterium]